MAVLLARGYGITKKAADLSIGGLCVSKLVGMRGFEPPTP